MPLRADAERYIAAGCNDYLAKPIDRNLLQRKIERAIGPIQLKMTKLIFLWAIFLVRSSLQSGQLSQRGLFRLASLPLDGFLAPLLPRTFAGPVVIRAKEKIVPGKIWKDRLKQWAGSATNKPKSLKRLPVFGVSRYACLLYAGWLSQRHGRSYRLPSELEWELAARGVDGRTYSWGEIYWLGAAKLNAGYGAVKINPVAEIVKNAADISVWEIHDLCGSLGEWTWQR